MKKSFKKIKIMAFDIDGTILEYPNYHLNSEIIEMFKSLKSKKYITVLTTARDMITIGSIKNIPNIDYFIGANGAFIFDLKNQKMLWESNFDNEDVNKLVKFLTENNLEFYLSGKDKAYNSSKFNMDDWFVKPFKNQFMHISEHNIGDLNFIDIVTNKKHLIALISDFLIDNNLKMDINSLWHNGLFISPKGIHKSSTLNNLCKMINSKYSIHKNVMSFGDSENDIEMIIDSYHGVALGNAQRHLKMVADDISPDVKDNGVKLYLERLGII